MQPDIADRLAQLRWDVIGEAVNRDGFAVTSSPLPDAAECTALGRGVGDDDRFRATSDMARPRFGEGCYRYSRYPPPPVVAELRKAAYPYAMEIANSWAKRLGEPPFPRTH